MTNQKITKILKSFRITIPKEARKELDLKVGDYVMVSSNPNYLKIYPVNIRKRRR